MEKAHCGSPNKILGVHTRKLAREQRAATVECACGFFFFLRYGPIQLNAKVIEHLKAYG